MASKRRGGFRTPELRGTLGTLLRTTTDVVRDALERGASAGRARLDDVRSSRRRQDALAELGELVLDLIRRGEIDLAELPEARDLVRHLDELDAASDGDEAEDDGARATTRRRFDDRATRLHDAKRNPLGDGTVSASARRRSPSDAATGAPRASEPRVGASERAGAGDLRGRYASDPRGIYDDDPPDPPRSDARRAPGGDSPRAPADPRAPGSDPRSRRESSDPRSRRDSSARAATSDDHARRHDPDDRPPSHPPDDDDDDRLPRFSSSVDDGTVSSSAALRSTRPTTPARPRPPESESTRAATKPMKGPWRRADPPPAPPEEPAPARRPALAPDPHRKGGISFDDDDLNEYMHPDDVPPKGPPRDPDGTDS